MTQLSQGAISAIYHGTDDSDAIEPIFQVLSVKKVNPAGAGVDRYRLIVSDGVHFAQAMLATQMNELVTIEPSAIQKMCIVKLLAYACNVVQSRKIIICLNVEVVALQDEKLGDPKAIDGNEAGGTPAPVSAPAAAAAPAAPVGRGGSNASSTSAAKSRQAGGKPQTGGAGPGAPIYPIEGLSPYQNKWTIKARVVSKSDVRHWTNARGEGKLFSVNLLDETGEIKATGFNEAVDRLEPLFEEGKVYYISKARVNIAKKQFSNLSNEYEIMFENGTEVQLCEDQTAVPQVSYNFVELAALVDHDKDATIDVLGIVKDNGEVSEITAKATQRQIKKRELTIVDRSGYSVRVTLWGRGAESWVDSDGGIFAFKGAKVGDFGGRTLSMGGQSTITSDPDVPEAHTLRGWYDTEGQTTSFSTYNSSSVAGAGGSFTRNDEFKTLEQVKTDELGMGDKPDYFSSRATITFIKSDNLSYPACPTEKCNKKITMESDDAWRCEKCDQVFAAPEYRYILSCIASDATGQLWLSGFNEIGQQLLGRTADDLQQMKDQDERGFSQIVAGAVGKMYNFTCRAKADSFNDQVKVRYHINRAAPVDWVTSAKALLADIAKY